MTCLMRECVFRIDLGKTHTAAPICWLIKQALRLVSIGWPIIMAFLLDFDCCFHDMVRYNYFVFLFSILFYAL